MEGGAYMEQAAAWGRPCCEFQLPSKGSVEESAASGGAHVWAPAGFPLVMEYAATDIFRTTSLQPYFHSSSSVGQQQQQQQMALYNYNYGDQSGAAAQEPSDADALGVFEYVTNAFEDEAQPTKVKMHRFPPAFARAVGKSYTVPRVVAIGPYHHHRKHLMAVERVKHVAAYHCIVESGCTVRQMYDAVVSVADRVRALYDKNVMARISDDDFRHMMFFDACFLVQYMLSRAGGCDPTLCDFFASNESDILHDTMLLENQIPWPVVQAVMDFTPVSLGKLIGSWRGRLQDRMAVHQQGLVEVHLDASYNPPHLLGFVRFYLVGSRSSNFNKAVDKEIKAVSVSVSAVELAEMGINLRANQTTELAHMGLVNKCVFFGELSMAPLSLDNRRASWLVNMAALELCTTPYFFADEAEYEDSAACSYLLLLCMLVHREEDVHQLRTKGILQGGAGLTNKEALRFFTSLHNSLRSGCYYAHVMVQIERYRITRWIRIKLFSFVYRNWKTIVGVGSAIGAFAGIITTLNKYLKGSH